MENDDKFDLIVIGAGISGIYATKFYLDVHPDCKVIVLDRDSCIGGVWNSRRGYDNFFTQFTHETAEFSDLRMPRPPEEDTYYDFFKAKYVTEYLESYIDHQKYKSGTLRDRIKLGIEVQSLRKIDVGWTLTTKDRATGAEKNFHTSKLLVACGLFCIPKMPSLPGKENFNGPIIHQDEFGSSKILSNASMQNITVLGGGKSGADMVYAAAEAGKNVTWVLKASDTSGPGLLLSPKGKGPYKNSFEIGMTRVAATLDPSYLNIDSWWMRLLHGTKWGAKIVSGAWGTIDKESRKEANFQGRGDGKGFEKLAPHSPIFWQNVTGGLIHHDNFFDTISKNVQIHVADVLSLERGHVRLRTGETIMTDVLLCGTGWSSPLTFFSHEQCQNLGLPYPRNDEEPKHKDHWDLLEAAADARVLASFPMLGNPPALYERHSTSTPYRLYKNMVPLPSDDIEDDHSIVFIGQLLIANYFMAAQCQAMWATAYMDRKLTLPSKEEQEKEVALFTAWCKRRYLNTGEDGHNLTFETLGYTDDLLKHMGLKSHRKGWFKDLFAPVMGRNFEGVKGEYIKKYGVD